MSWGIFLLLTLLGLSIGSFVSVVSYRLPKGLGFVLGRSFCDLCKKELEWYDNIPVFSYLFYFGKSRCCGKIISIRYPLIEMSSALGLVILYLIFGFQFLIINYSLFILLLAILIIDLEHQIIPDELIWLVLLLFLFSNPYSLFSNLFASFFFSLLFIVLYLITSGKGMGLGDVKLAIGLGAWLGWLDGWKWLLISFILGGITATILLLLKKANMKTKIAFGPFMIIAFWIILCV